MNPLFTAWLQQSALIFLLIGSLAGILVGAMLVFSPQRFHSVSALLNRWISTRNFDKPLERSFALDPWLYRYRNITGTAILFGALFVLYYFSVVIERDLSIAGLARHFHYPPLLVAGLLDALVLSALVGAFCAVLVALFMLFRPSLLRDFEQGANQWLSLRKALKPMEIPRDDVNLFVLRYTRQVGIFLMLGGLYTLVLMLYWMSRYG